MPDSPPDPERETLAALDRHDHEAALQLLMNAYGVALYRYCRQMVRDPDLAEEAHQMTFVQAFESLGRFGRRSSLRTWLFGIARHRCLDAAKIRRRRQQRFELVDVPPELPDATPNAEERLEQKNLRRLLARCLEQLAPKIRHALLLRFQANLSYPEIAATCRERPPTLQARVARALPVLRRCLEAQSQ